MALKIAGIEESDLDTSQKIALNVVKLFIKDEDRMTEKLNWFVQQASLNLPSFKIIQCKQGEVNEDHKDN